MAELRSGFDRRRILRAVDELDGFCAEWKRELRVELLQVHAMAHTVINDAPLSIGAVRKAGPKQPMVLRKNFESGSSPFEPQSLCWMRLLI